MTSKVERNSNIYFVYRHIRLDKNEVFYVGIGIKPKLHDKTYENEYKRAFARNGRNKFWNNITNKTDYRIEIMFECDNEKEVINKEIEFIKLYGRRDLGLGTLANLTDGGDGLNRYFSLETRTKISKFHKGRIRSKEVFDKISKAKKKPIIQYNLEGDFIREWESTKDAASELGIASRTIGQILGKDFWKYTAKGFRWKRK